MKDETKIMDIIIAISTLLIVFTNIIIGITILPTIAETVVNKWVPLLVSIGIMLQGIMTGYIGLNYAFKHDANRDISEGDRK